MHPSIPASEAKLHFGELLNRCVYGNEKIVITRHNKPLAVLSPARAEDLRDEAKDGEIEADENVPAYVREIMAMRRRILAGLKGKKRKGPDAVTLIRQIRDEEENR